MTELNRRSLLAGAVALGLPAAGLPAAARAQTAPAPVVFWHAMSGPLGEEVNRLCAAFNASQSDAKVEPIFKGTYSETLTAAIAAWRAGKAPHLVQMFEVGTGSMLAAGPAVKQNWQLAQETGVALDASRYLGGVRGYYSLPDGRLASTPFNSSTAMMWYNKDAFAKAGLDPEAPPTTWPALIEACRALKAKGGITIPMTTAWAVWIQLEEFAAIHNIPYASKENGFAGLDTELLLNAPPFVEQVQRLLDMSQQGLFKYTGRDNAPDPVFPSGEAAISFNSSAARAAVARDAKFKWGEALLPYDPALTTKPINSIIGGASLWCMTAPNRAPAEYKGAAQFLAFLAQPENDAQWSQTTGYVPVTTAGYDLTRQQGFYARNPGSDLPIIQLTRGEVTANSRGLRLGRMSEIRNILYEEIERALQGQQTAQAALSQAVVRGNRVLRDFERSVKT